MESVKMAAGYIRVSTVEQSLKGLSIETQIAEIEQYAKSNNMKLVDIYIDRGITARKQLTKRVEFMRMMHDVEAGKIDHIIVLRLDRFFRNIYDYHRMMNEYLTPNNCDWSAVKEQYSTATTNGRLMINLRLAIAEQECDTDSDRIKDVQKHRVSEGYIISGGGTPLGLKIENKRIVKDEQNYIAKEIYDYFEEHGSIRGTMLYINQKHNLHLIYPTVSRVLRNAIYKGQYRDNVNFCEPTVSTEQWAHVQSMLTKNIRERGKPQVYIFSGLLRCTNCGHSLAGSCTVKDGKIYKYYRCHSRTINGTCDNTKNCSESVIEEHIFNNLEKIFNDRILTLQAEEQKRKAVKSNRKQIEAKLKKLNDLYINDFITMEEYKAEYAKLQSMIVEPVESPKVDLTHIKKIFEGDYKARYKDLSEEQKRAFWRCLIKEIRVFKKTVESVEFLL